MSIRFVQRSARQPTVNLLEQSMNDKKIQPRPVMNDGHPLTLRKGTYSVGRLLQNGFANIEGSPSEFAIKLENERAKNCLLVVNVLAYSVTYSLEFEDNTKLPSLAVCYDYRYQKPLLGIDVRKQSNYYHLINDEKASALVNHILRRDLEAMFKKAHNL